mgnify:CR=1 FL=1
MGPPLEEDREGDGEGEWKGTAVLGNLIPDS